MKATDSPTVHRVLAHAESALAPQGNSGARLEAEVLLAHALGRTRSWLYAWPEHRLEGETLQHFQRLLEERNNGKPIAYVIGKREFWSLELAVTEHTLIPRHDTETLVEWALRLLVGTTRPKILDLGTGCGAIALALASERPDAEILATDCDQAALSTAQANAKAHTAHRIQFLQGDWLQPIAADVDFDLIVSNPPYVAEGDPHLQCGDARFEPRLALCAGPDGLFALRAILGAAPRFLRPGGWLLVEHGAWQGPAVRSLFQSASLDQTTTYCDLAGRERATGGVRTATP